MSQKNPKTGLHLRTVILGAFLFIVWIAFLFLDAKHQKSSQPLQSPSEILENSIENGDVVSVGTPRSGAEGLPAQSSDAEQNVEQQEDFLEREQDQRSETALGSLKDKIKMLEFHYEQDPSFKRASLLIEATLLDHQYTQAKKRFEAFPEAVKKQFPADTAFKLQLKSLAPMEEAEYHTLKQSFQQLITQNALSQEEASYYQSLFALVDGDYAQLKSLLTQLAGTAYQHYAQAIESAFAQYEQMQDVPTYYQQGLLAFQLMQEGQYALAKKLAIPLVNTYPNYILPHQVLANTDFILGRDESSLAYFQHLLKIDYQQKNNYLYHLGLLNYQLGNFTEAVLYFSQITDPNLMLDGDRYLVLCYLAIGDQEKALKSWKRLLGQPQIKKSDFFSFFEEAVWKPYRRGETSSYLEKDPQLVQSYLRLCEKRLKNTDQHTCQYGKVGIQIHQSPTTKSGLFKQVAPLAKKYPQAGLYQVLGDIAVENQQISTATEWYMKALALSEERVEKQLLKHKIIAANRLD